MTDRPPDPVADPDGSSPAQQTRRPRRRGLTRKFGTAFLLPALTALALMTFLSYVQSRRALEQSLGERLELLARLKESTLDDWIEHHVDDISLLASLPDVVTRQSTLLDEAEGPRGAEARAVLAPYAEDDWVRWGSAVETRGVDFEGHELRFDYTLTRSLGLVARGYFVESLSTVEDGKRWRIDLNYRF